MEKGGGGSLAYKDYFRVMFLFGANIKYSPLYRPFIKGFKLAFPGLTG